uniref:Immunoglobulin domain-containing protein n=1 Tax=Cyprinus carpio TaxID=7962 RepID=A0A8C2FGH5_CYPCA
MWSEIWKGEGNLCLMIFLSIRETGYSGGGVNITCRYDREYTDNTKYFCRGEWKITCSDLIRTDMKNNQVDSGRFSLFDDTTAAVFTVTFRNLSKQDSGMYRCGVDISLSEDTYTEVNLNIKSELQHKSPKQVIEQEICYKDINRKIRTT